MYGAQLFRSGRTEGLRRSLGAPSLFAIVQSFVSASIYFVLGIITDYAGSLTWAVFLAAGLFFTLLVLSYVEGASLHPERGGATIIARYGFNELVSFIAGWAICLDYLILVAITAFVATDYLAVFLPAAESGLLEFLFAVAIILFVALVNIRGVTARGFERVVGIVLFDVVLQTVVVILALIFLFDPQLLTDPAAVSKVPTLKDTIIALTLAVAAFSGLDASAGLAGEVRVGRRGLKRLISVRLLAGIVPYVGIALVSASILPNLPNGFSEAPFIDVVSQFDQPLLRNTLRYTVAISAIAILVLACTAAMLGVSRLAHSLAINRQLPVAVGRLGETRSTPFILIAIAAVLAIMLLIPADLELLIAMYAYGAMLAFTIVHLSVCRSRMREPDRKRPYRIPVNLRIGGTEMPLSALIGAFMSFLAFLSILFFHSGARIVGTVWMLFGILTYVLYRLRENNPILARITVPEEALRSHGSPSAEYRTILVPLLGTPLDDDIMQTAGRLASEHIEESDGGAEIEALWIYELPMSVPLDAALDEQALKRGRAALSRAKAVGEEYQGVTVSTNTLRARRAGEAIIGEAKRKGVEAIVLAAEEPTRMRGGVLLGGRQGLWDTFVGETTRYIINKAPCRVVLTAPPAPTATRQEAQRIAEEDISAPPQVVDPTISLRRHPD